jgi:hypothetical protein
LAGQKSSNGSVSLGIEEKGRTRINTLKSSRHCHSEAELEEGMSGEGVKAALTCSEKNPQGLKT